MERLLAPLETVFDEWKQHPVFFVGVMKKGADVTLRVKHRACEPNGLAGLTRRSSAGLRTIMSGIHRVLLRQAAARSSRSRHGKNRRKLLPAPSAKHPANGASSTQLLWLSKEILRSLR